MSDMDSLVDARNAAQLRDGIAAILRDKLRANVKGMESFDSATFDLDGVSAPELLRIWLNAMLRMNVDPDISGQDQANAALTGIFLRFAEILLQRLNQVPQKNFLAFLDLIGASRLPPQPARVPLTFTLAPGSASDGVVLAFTQVAAPPREGEKDPVIFETERELTVVAARLQTLIAVDAERDMVADHSAFLASPSAAGVCVFGGDRFNEHALYIGHDGFPNYPALRSRSLYFDVVAMTRLDTWSFAWEYWDGAQWSPLDVIDNSKGLRESGTVTFTYPSVMSELTLGGIMSRWVRMRLLTPISATASVPLSGMVRETQLPRLKRVNLGGSVSNFGIVPEKAFTNAQAVDVTKPFYPFGERPRLGDVFYLAHTEAFGIPGAKIVLEFTLLEPVADPKSVVLKWETWTGSAWATPGGLQQTGATNFKIVTDANGSPTNYKYKIEFTLPATIARTMVNGVDNYWVRVQIAGGNYGQDVSYVADIKSPVGVTITPASFKPPVVGVVTIAYDATISPVSPDAVLACNNLEFEDLADGLALQDALPFHGFDDVLPTLYAAFTLPPTRKAFPNRSVTLFHAVRLFQYGEKSVPLHPDFRVDAAEAGGEVVHRYTLTNGGSEGVSYSLSTMGNFWKAVVAPEGATLAPGETVEVTVTVSVPPLGDLANAGKYSDRGFLQLYASSDGAIHSVVFETRVGTVAPQRREIRWEYWNGRGWKPLAAVDGTDRLNRSGMVEFLGPGDFVSSERFGVNGYWLRAALEPGDSPILPRLTSLLPNTTFATQSVTLRNEVLGSSDGTENQRFATKRSPVLAAQQLGIREPGPLSQEEVGLLGAGAISAANGRGTEVWVRWSEVPDFHGSGPHDRHYLLDHITGKLSFGDGVQGRIPPRGIGNIRMTRYQTGGGGAGNRAAGAIVQLKTTVPYIEKVYNAEPAAGGFVAESYATLTARAPRMLRHGMRAVAFEDYEDLAHLATPEVARARCVPLCRLRDDPLGTLRVPGAVSVIVVPGGSDPKPLPSSELLERVEDYLRTRACVAANIAVVGPLYVRVDVTLEVALTTLEGASAVEQAIRAALDAFLHPLSGGREGSGWDFGREPHDSDLHALVSAVPGVDHLRRLTVTQHQDLSDTSLADVKQTGRFLVYSGEHSITLTYVGAE